MYVRWQVVYHNLPKKRKTGEPRRIPLRFYNPWVIIKQTNYWRFIDNTSSPACLEAVFLLPFRDAPPSGKIERSP